VLTLSPIQAASEVASTSDLNLNNEAGLLGHWIFDRSKLSGKSVADLTGRNPAVIEADGRIVDLGLFDALQLTGRDGGAVIRNGWYVDVPTQSVTVEAWVALSDGIPFGAVMAAGEYRSSIQRGWVLGYDNRKLGFWLSSYGTVIPDPPSEEQSVPEQKPLPPDHDHDGCGMNADTGDEFAGFCPHDPRLSLANGDHQFTALMSEEPFTLGTWYHIAGTYDGSTMTFYVDGVEQATSEAESGSIEYPFPTSWNIGVFRDSDESYPMRGLVHESRIYSRALTAEEVRAHYEARMWLKAAPAPEPTPRPLPPPEARESPLANQRALIIGIDGLRADAVATTRPQNLIRLMKQSLYSLRTQASTGQRTISGPGWSSIMTGVWADRHGVDDNFFRTPNLQQNPTLFTRVLGFDPNSLTASYVAWPYISNYLIRNATAGAGGISDRRVMEDGAAILSRYGPDLLFLHFLEVDLSGHYDGGFTPLNPNYVTAIHRVDGFVGHVLDALEQRRAFAPEEDWLIVVVSDHGGRGNNHGGMSIEELQVPLIANRRDGPVGRLVPSPYIVDVAPTVLAHLGIATPPDWEFAGLNLASSQTEVSRADDAWSLYDTPE
jgi:hypothetical protein